MRTFYPGRRRGGFQKGHPKWGGRQDKASVARHLLARFPELAVPKGATPLYVLARAMNGDRSILAMQVRAAKAALPYVEAWPSAAPPDKDSPLAVILEIMLTGG
jgi:hypothetical protein